MAKMIIDNICPFCGEYIKQEEPHEYTINKEGNRKVKHFFHSSCFEEYLHSDDDEV